MNEEPYNPSIGPELESRIVALVLGEASDLEREELNRQIEQRPDLAAFKLRMQEVHGLLQDVGVGEFAAPDEDWKLPTDRRNVVLAVIRGEATVQPADDLRRRAADVNPLIDDEDSAEIRGLTSPARLVADDGLSADAAKNKSPRRLLRNLTCVLAVVCVAVATMFYSFSSQERAASEYFYSAAKTDANSVPWSSANSAPVSMAHDWTGIESPASRIQPHDDVTVPGMLSFAGEPGSADADVLLYAGSVDVDYAKSSETALSALQDTLGRDATLPSPDYLTDDIEYFPAGPEFKLRETVAQHGASTLEKEGRSTATFDDGTSSTGAVDIDRVITRNEWARNDAAWMSRDLGEGDQDSPAKSDSATENKGEVAFPNLVDNSGDVSDSAPAAAKLRIAVPDGNPVLLGAINIPSSGDRAPIGGGPEASAPRTLVENEAEVVSETPLDLTLSALSSQVADLQKKLAQQPQFSNPNEPGADLSKDRAGLGPAGNKIAGEQREKEAKPKDRLSFAGTAVDAAGTLSLESLQEAIPQPGDEMSDRKESVEGRSGDEPSNSTSQPMTLNGEEPKSEKSGAAAHVEEDFEQKLKRGGMVSSDDVLLDRVGVDDDFSVQNLIEAPTDTPALQSRRFTIPDAHAGSDNGIPDNRESDSIRSPAPVTGKTPAQPKSEEMPIIDGFNSAARGVIRIREKERQVEEQGKSDVKGMTHSFFRQFGNVPPTLDDDSESKKRPVAKTVAPSVGLNETTAAAEAFSTFSLHVSDVSFKLAAAALARGEWPEAAKVRIEEFVNAFDYGDPLPCKGEKVACAVEQSIHPFVQQRNLLRVSMRTAVEGRASNTPLRLTFLLDNSGSMERTDRQETVRRAFALLSQQLSPIDQVTLISFARQPRLLAEKVSGAESGQLVKLIDELPSEGGTNIEAALQLAFEKATQQQTSGAQNRIILLTDGAVNLGDADPESLSRMVTTMRDAGIAFDAAGISAEGLNDEVLEALTRKGDGRYYLLDSFEDADDSFARQIAGALRPSASNVKVQVEFNPKRVGHYRLLGFEKHILKQEDFRNDAVDAAEMAAAEAGVALYQFEAKPDGEGDVGSVSVRFRDLSTGQMVENRWPIPYEADAPRPDQAAPSLRIAISAALLAAKLRGEPLGEAVDLKTLSDLISGLPEQDQNNTRVQQLKLMIEQARQMSGK